MVNSLTLLENPKDVRSSEGLSEGSARLHKSTVLNTLDFCQYPPRCQLASVAIRRRATVDNDRSHKLLPSKRTPRSFWCPLVATSGVQGLIPGGLPSGKGGTLERLLQQ